MKFRRETKAEGFFLEDGVDSVRFGVPGEHRVAVVILPAESDSKSTYNAGIQIRADVEFEPTKTRADALAALEKGRLPDDTPPRKDWPHDFDYIDENGKVEEGYAIPKPILSKGLQDFFDSVHEELARATHRVFGLLRWRMAMEGPHSPSLTGEITWWAERKQQWLPFPSSTSVTLSDHGEPPLRPDVQMDIQQMLEADQQEPLAHLLLREARGQQPANPRSAILIGLSALETGTKHFVSGQVPDATWLLAESPSPPIVRLLTDYVPKLTRNAGTSFHPPEGALLATLKKGVSLRNKVAHTGHSDFRDETVEEILNAVENMLWRLDVAAGFSWAEWWVSAYPDHP